MPTDPTTPPQRSPLNFLAYEVGDWRRRLRENTAQEREEEQSYHDAGGLSGALGRFGTSLAGSFEAGSQGLPDPSLEGQKVALRSLPEAQNQPPSVDPGVGADGIPNALRKPDSTSDFDPKAGAAALSRGLQRRAYLNSQSPAAGLEGEDLRKAAGYRDMTNEVANFVGPREPRYIQGQAYTPALGGGGVSTFETPDSVREQMVRDAEETKLARAIEDPDNLGTLQRRTDIERSSLEQLESHRSNLAKELESHRSGLIGDHDGHRAQQAMEYLDQIEQQELDLFRKDPRYQKLTPAQIEYAEAKLRADQMAKRAELRLAALGGPGGIAQYLEQQRRFPQ